MQYLVYDIPIYEIQGSLKKNFKLSRYTSWKIGGDADYLFKPANLADLSNFLTQLPMHIPVTFIGLGSNILIRDKGIRGVVVLTLNCLKEYYFLNDNDLYCESGVTCAKLAKISANAHKTGGEFFAGIPGTFGGALYMNAGAFGGETWNLVQKLNLIDRTGKIYSKTEKEFTVSYRFVSLPKNIWFAGAVLSFQDCKSNVAQQNIKNLLKLRSQKQPIGLLSCGSVFKNPPNNSAGNLIDKLGLKNKKIGGAYISDVHANFIINDKTATAENVEDLIKFIQQSVYDAYNVKLELEVKILGEN